VRLLWPRPLYGKSEGFCLLKQPVQILATRTLKIVDVPNLLETLAKFLQLVSEGFGGLFWGLGVFEKEIQRLNQLVLVT
jgi:hypothetical protein